MKRKDTVPMDGVLGTNRLASAATEGVPTPESPRLRPVDALELWDAESAGSGGAGLLSVIRTDGNEHLLIPFTTSMVRVTLHYLDYPSIRSYLHCNQPDCVLCRIGRQVDVRDLLPVFDPLDQAVGVLPVSTNLRPMALRPQLAAVLRQLKEGTGRALISIRRLDAGKFDLNTLPLSEDADDGAAKIRDFHRLLKAGEIDLAGVYPRLANDELAAIPEIAKTMEIKGIKLP